MSLRYSLYDLLVDYNDDSDGISHGVKRNQGFGSLQQKKKILVNVKKWPTIYAFSRSVL